jgi:quercetin dioxygenase-like cupin family protein
MAGSKVIMKTGDFIAIPAKEEHEILATEDSRILLTKGV